MRTHFVVDHLTIGKREHVETNPKRSLAHETRPSCSVLMKNRSVEKKASEGREDVGNNETSVDQTRILSKGLVQNQKQQKEKFRTRADKTNVRPVKFLSCSR
jgi:hypothetical protein